jgi:hypothetical protein
MSQPEASANIRFTNDDAGTHKVPADVLARAVSGMQQLAYLIGAAQEQKTIGIRFRLSQEIEQRYRISCELSRPGSYVVPISLGSDDVDMSLFTSYSELLSKIEILFAAIQQGNSDQLLDVFPDGKLRNRALREVRKLLPKLGEGWKFGFQHGSNAEVLLAPDSAIGN